MPVVPTYSLGPHSFGTTDHFLSVTAHFRGCPVVALIDSACNGLLISQACLDRLGLKPNTNSQPVEMEVADGQALELTMHARVPFSIPCVGGRLHASTLHFDIALLSHVEVPVGMPWLVAMNP